MGDGTCSDLYNNISLLTTLADPALVCLFHDTTQYDIDHVIHQTKFELQILTPSFFLLGKVFILCFADLVPIFFFFFVVGELLSPVFY